MMRYVGAGLWLRRGVLGLAAMVALGLVPGLAVGQAAAQSKDVLVFAAASLKNALDDIHAQYTKDTGKQLSISLAASPQLAKQIESGAPADIFISADLDWMDYLAQKNLIKPDTRKNLLGNELVLIAPKDSKAEVKIAPRRRPRQAARRRQAGDGGYRRGAGRKIR